MNRSGFYLGWIGHANLGDEAMLHAAEACMSTTKWVPFYNESPRQLQRIRRNAPDTLFYGLQGGGTLINHNPGCFARYHNLSLGVGYVAPVFGTGVADPEYYSKHVKNWEDTRKYWASMLQDLDRVGVRGPLSKRLLEDAGLRNVEVCGDPAILFTTKYNPDRVSTGKIAVSIGHSYNNMWGDESGVESETVELVKKLKNMGHAVILVSVWPEDSEMLLRVQKSCGGATPLYEPCTVKQFKHFMLDVDVLVGLKLHSQILAVTANVPIVPLEYRPKCRDFAESICYKTIRTDEYTADNVLERIDAIYKDIGIHRHVLEVFALNLKERFLDYINTYVSPLLATKAERNKC